MNLAAGLAFLRLAAAQASFKWVHCKFNIKKFF